MLFLAFKRVLPRGLVMSLCVALAVSLASWFQSGRVVYPNVLLILVIAFVATFAIYVPVEYSNLKADAKRRQQR